MSKEEMIKQIETIVFEALGTASMCWSETPKGIFDSSQASNVGNEAVSNIMKLYVQFKQDKQIELNKKTRDLKSSESVCHQLAEHIEILNDKIKQFEANKQSDAVEFAEWISDNGWIKDPLPTKQFDDDVCRYSNMATIDIHSDEKEKLYTIQQLYTLFKDEQLKKK